MANHPNQLELELVVFAGRTKIHIEFNVDPAQDTVWATPQQIADLFEVDRTVASRHLKNIFDDKELDREATCAKIAQVQIEGGREVTRQIDHFNLDAILAVGYRVSSGRAAEFRRWASSTLKEYLVQGYALNEARLRDDPHALRELAAKVRTLRSDEKNIYKAVRDVFAFGSIDYDKDSQSARSFFAKVQDKFFYAITGQRASEIILDRADHTVTNMGLQTMKSDRPQMADVNIGKNYLVPDELYSLHILCEQFLLFVESRALRGQELTMDTMSGKFNELILVQGHPVFSEYKDYLTQRAKTHAVNELGLYRGRLRLEAHRQQLS